uniref:Secreted protein n=1 Tax=Heterorhabditis bacteriophora TaxID=37862 RepID=A0A1I7WDI2_HETBA
MVTFLARPFVTLTAKFVCVYTYTYICLVRFVNENQNYNTIYTSYIIIYLTYWQIIYKCRIHINVALKRAVGLECRVRNAYSLSPAVFLGN